MSVAQRHLFLIVRIVILVFAMSNTANAATRTYQDIGIACPSVLSFLSFQTGLDQFDLPSPVQAKKRFQADEKRSLQRIYPHRPLLSNRSVTPMPQNVVAVEEKKEASNAPAKQLYMHTIRMSWLLKQKRMLFKAYMLCGMEKKHAYAHIKRFIELLRLGLVAESITEDYLRKLITIGLPKHQSMILVARLKGVELRDFLAAVAKIKKLKTRIYQIQKFVFEQIIKLCSTSNEPLRGHIIHRKQSMQELITAEVAAYCADSADYADDEDSDEDEYEASETSAHSGSEQSLEEAEHALAGLHISDDDEEENLKVNYDGF